MCWETNSTFLPYLTEYQDDTEQISQLFNATQYSSAIKKIKEVESRLPDDWVHFSCALCHLFTDHVDEAIDLLEKVPHFEETSYFLALASIKKENILGAISHLKKYLSTSGEQQYRKEALLNLGIAYFFTEQYDKAKPLLKQSPKYLARLYMKEGRLDQAEQILNQELDYELMGKIRYAQGDYNKACEFFEKSKESLYQLGWSYLKLNRIDEAIQTFIKLLQREESEEAYLSLAQCYVIQGKEIDFLSSKMKSTEGKNFLRLLSGHLDLEVEMPYFQGLIAAHEGYYELAIQCLEREKNPTDQIMHLIGIIHFKHAQFNDAKTAFTRLINEHPMSPLAGEALYWTALCQDENRRSVLTQVYTQYPESMFAAEAYFHSYSYREYMQGDRAAIKHLQSFPVKFPNSPLILNALYLIGLDYTRDRKTPEGKWIRKKNLHAAIDAFESLEQAYHRINPKGNYVELFDQAMLEQGLIYFTMASESQGAKKQIYLEFAEKTFRNISLPSLKEQSAYWLAKTLIAANELSAATHILNTITQGVYYSLACYEKGRIAMNHSIWKEALCSFEQADAHTMSIDEKLTLWIDQSECYKQLNQLDQAMLILSKVINDDAISSLRLKAMYLRSEIYEKQGRLELARKQLEATAQKGGEWGKHALAKLEKEYGFP